ncbi:MAG: 2-phosphosulfolactate phosphatase [Bacteroidia bacterium]|nr:2-phosphosulfolactate phosphatase [Bacteroidia bacterium]
MLKLDVCLSPLLYQEYFDRWAVVIVDVIRASTSICTAFSNGVTKIIPVAEESEALAYRQKGYLISGERNSVKLEGYDFGNSPFDFISDDIKGKSLVMTTTNGTQAIKTAKNAIAAAIGAFVNAGSLLQWLQKQRKNVVFLCSGWQNSVNIEDTLLAGMICENLLKTGDYVAGSDAVNIALCLYQASGNDMMSFVLNKSPRLQSKKELLGRDIEFCLSGSRFNIVPVIKNGIIYPE